MKRHDHSPSSPDYEAKKQDYLDFFESFPERLQRHYDSVKEEALHRLREKTFLEEIVAIYTQIIKDVESRAIQLTPEEYTFTQTVAQRIREEEAKEA